MNPVLAALLEELALKELKILVPLLGEFVVEAIAALVARLRAANPNHPEGNKILDDVGNLGIDIVERLDAIDWGTFFTKDEVNKLKEQTALRLILAEASERGKTLFENTASDIIKSSVEIVRARALTAIEVKGA